MELDFTYAGVSARKHRRIAGAIEERMPQLSGDAITGADAKSPHEASAAVRRIARITQPLEVAIIITDIARLVRFYTEVLGCVEEKRAAVPAEVNGPLGIGGATTIVFLATPHGERIKLTRPELPAPEPIRPAHLSLQRGLSFLTLYVDDADAVLENVGAYGGRVLSEPPLRTFGDKRVGTCADPEGNVLEIVDYLPG